MNTKSKRWYGLADLEKRYGKLNLGRVIWSWRMSEEISQVDFAERLGLSRANLCDIEKGRKRVSPEKAATIAEKIGVPASFLIQMAVEEQLQAAGLKFYVTVRPAA